MFLLACSQAIAYIDRVNLSVVGPELVRNHHYSPALPGVLFSVFNWSFTLSLILAGPFTDWVRPRMSYPHGVGMWSLATVMCVIRETYERKNRAVIVGTFLAGNKIGVTLGIQL